MAPPTSKRQTRSKTVPPGKDTYTVRCYFRGDNKTYRVLVSRTDEVEDLVEKLAATWTRELDGSFAYWKVGKELKPYIKDLVAFRPDDESDVQLVNTFQPISDLWKEEPPAKFVHLFVDVPEMPPPSTNQGTSRRFMCLVVDGIGTPRKQLPIKGADDDYVLDLAESILHKIADQVAPADINLWKPLSFDKSPRDTHSERVKDFLEAPDHRGAVLMEMYEPLLVYFPPGRSLPPEQIHIVAHLPPSEKDLKKSILLPTDKDTLLPFETAITFTIPSKKHFPSLKEPDVGTDEVKLATTAAPPFIEDFLTELDHPRVVPSGSSLPTTLSKLLSPLGISFDEHFTSPQQVDQPPPDERVVTTSEFGQYIQVLCNNPLDVGQFRVSKEEQIGVFLLRELAREFKRLSSNHTATFRNHWSFPLIALARNNGERFQYTPKSDFSLQIEEFPHCILEVTSSDIQADLWRMMLQASCLARLGNELRRGNTTIPVVIMAVYIDSHLRAQEYLVYQPDLASKTVEYRKTVFDLTDPRSAFKFTFRLHNFLPRAASDHNKFKKAMSQELETMANYVLQLKLPKVTSKMATDKPGGGGGGGSGAGTKRGQDPDLLGDPSVQNSLKEAGYELTPADPMLVPISGLKSTMRDATSSDGSRVVLKVLDRNTLELAVLEYLNEIKQADNHAIELHGVVDVTVAKVIALPWMIPLDMYFNPFSPPDSAASFPEHFLESVAFLHAHKVAHLDLKPDNVVIEESQRLIIIDFDLSVFVEDEHTTIKGFRGTAPWVAPEVGTCDGPEMTFSPILADRWACGRMLRYLETLPGCGDGSRYQVQETLMSDNPRSRPSLKDVLDGYGRYRVKRIAEAEKGGGVMQKKPRMMYTLT